MCVVSLTACTLGVGHVLVHLEPVQMVMIGRLAFVASAAVVVCLVGAALMVLVVALFQCGKKLFNVAQRGAPRKFRRTFH